MSMKILLWSIGAFIGVFQPANGASVICFCGSLSVNVTAPLASAETLIDSKCFDKSLNSSFYTFGFGGKVDGNATTTVLKALFKIGINVCLLDWSKEANRIVNINGSVDSSLSYILNAAPRSRIVGRSFGEALIRMSKKGLNLSKTWCIAHSLGAHLFGVSGKYVIANNQTLYQIIGLDPAGPLFDKPAVYTPLGKDCASFVASIHTDPGKNGMNTSTATVDIWANYGNYITGNTSDQKQPGCTTENISLFSQSTYSYCSHDRSWMLFVEALKNYQALLASKATNYSNWKSVGKTSEVINLGLNITRTATGNFYLVTNSASPYGKGVDGLHE